MLVSQLLAKISAELVESGIPAAEAHSMARWLLADFLQLPHSQLAFHLREQVQPAAADQAALQAKLLQLKNGMPLQYLLGQTEFMGLPFFCSPAALIPRQDSEVLVEKGISLLQEQATPQIADTCCGSGTFALSLAHFLPTAQVTATDISADALALAAKNARALGVAERVRFLQGDLLQPLLAEQMQFDLLCSNPPYISSEELLQLDACVQQEPALALDGGADGLIFYRRLAADVAQLLKPKGYLLLEHGDDQQQAVAEIMQAAGLLLAERICDYGGRERGLLLQKQDEAR